MNTRNRTTAAFPWTLGVSRVQETKVPAYRVGEMYQPGRSCWPESVQYGYGPRGHELTLFVPGPSPDEIDDIRCGDAQFALTVLGPVFYLAFRFGETADWHDVPYVWQVQYPEARATPPAATSPETRALLWISLVDADGGIIRAQRGVTLSPSFTRRLHQSIRDQAEGDFDPLECTLTIAETCRLRPSAAQRLLEASAWSHANS